MGDIRKCGGIGFLSRMALIHGSRDLVRSWLRVSPHKVPLAGRPGTTAVVPLADAWRFFSKLSPNDLVTEGSSGNKYVPALDVWFQKAYR